MLKIIFICISVIYGFIYLILAAKTGKPFKTILFYSAAGIMGMVLVNLTAKFSGIYIPVNLITVGSAAALGLPGTVSLLILKIIFI